MALRRIPVDMMASPFDTATLAMVRPKTDMDGVQKQTDDGVGLWEYDLLVTPPDRRPEVVPITAPSRSTPSYTPGCRVRVGNCYVIHYSISNRGKVNEGFAFSADEVSPYPAAARDDD